MQAMATALTTSRDVILFFSYSGSTRDMEEILKLAKHNKVRIILITHFKKSRAAEFADVVLLCGYNESPLQSGSIAAKVGQMFLIDCLFYGFCRKNPELYSAARAATAQSIAKNCYNRGKNKKQRSSDTFFVLKNRCFYFLLFHFFKLICQMGCPHQSGLISKTCL